MSSEKVQIADANIQIADANGSNNSPDNSQILADWLAQRSLAQPADSEPTSLPEPYESPYQSVLPPPASQNSTSEGPVVPEPMVPSTQVTPGLEPGVEPVPSMPLGVESVPNESPGVEPNPDLPAPGPPFALDQPFESPPETTASCGDTVLSQIEGGLGTIAKPVYENATGALILAIGADLLIGRGKGLPITSSLLRSGATLGRAAIQVGSRSAVSGATQGAKLLRARPLATTGLALGGTAAWLTYDKINECSE